MNLIRTICSICWRQLNARIFDFQMHLMLTADSKEELDLLKMQIKSYLAALNMGSVALMFEQEKVLKSIVPIFPKQDIENRIGTPIPVNYNCCYVSICI